MSDPTMPNGYTLQQVESCTLRGSKIGGIAKQGKCGGCSTKNLVEVYRCGLHGSCTYTRVQTTQSHWVCTTCTDVKLPETE